MGSWARIPPSRHILTPEEWNRVVDAIEELDGRAPVERKGGVASFTGDGVATEFTIAHGLTAAPTVAFVGKKTSGLPAIDSWDADATNIVVRFVSAVASGVSFELWWLALRL